MLAGSAVVWVTSQFSENSWFYSCQRFNVFLVLPFFIIKSLVQMQLKLYFNDI